MTQMLELGLDTFGDVTADPSWIRRVRLAMAASTVSGAEMAKSAR